MNSSTLKFIKNPTQKNLDRLDSWVLYIIYGWCMYCINNEVGNVELSKKLKNILIPNLTKNICFDRLGVKSLLLACKTLALNKLNRQNTRIIVHIDNIISLEIFYDYDPKLPNMFLVKQTDDRLGVDKELLLYYEGLKEYLVDLFTDNNKLIINIISLNINNKEKIFYTDKLGVVFDMYKCATCVHKLLNNEEIPESCKKMIDEKCYKKFRNSPEFIFEKKQREVVEIKKINNVKDMIKSDFWTCGDCTLENSPDLKKCKACKSTRKYS